MASTRRRGSEARTTETTSARRKMRSRPTPRWLEQGSDLDEIARRRCLMLLTVLSGERPVSEVIAELAISRGTYYQLEDRALRAMLTALTPGVSAETPEASPARRIAQLEQKVTRLERDKRRLERLLLLTRKVVAVGPVKTSAGGRPPSRSTRRGKSASSGSKKKTRTPTTTKTSTAASKSTPPAASIPTSDGADAS